LAFAQTSSLLVACLLAGFLPDAKRQRAMEDMRMKLKQEWLQEQARLKEAPLAVKFSYWDGSGHQRNVTVLVGDTVGAFIKKARLLLEKDFPQLRHVTVPNLLLVKDDIILPQAMTFYSLIVSKSHNGRGQLLFDADSPVGAQKVHSAKVVQRSWYESNKHIYPANRWELFDEHMHVLR
jgi:protein FAM50